jgi:hypothetical protein
MSEELRASFEKLIGQEIKISSPALGNDPAILHPVILRGLESGGLWIESAERNQTFLRRHKI